MTDSVSRLVSAAEATLSSGSTRVARKRFPFPRPDDDKPVAALFCISERGVADLARRRVRLERDDTEELERLVGWLDERFPWLSDDEDSGNTPADEPPTVTVFAGSASFFGVGNRWTTLGEGDPNGTRRAPNDPLWIVEGLRLVDEADDRGDDEIRGEQCARLGFHIDLEQHRQDIERPARSSGYGHVLGEAWIGQDGRIRRVVWTSSAAKRRRAPASGGDTKLWELLELWDFGVEASIDLPDATPIEGDRWWPVSLAQFGFGLWRRKKDWEHQQSDAGTR